jgi:hypothetical protein
MLPDPGREPTTEITEFSVVRWAVSPGVELHWRDWGCDSVVYEARSGQILQLDALSAAVMGSLEERASTVLEVSESLSHDLPATNARELCDVVESIVDNFRRLGWVEPIIAR